MQAYAYESAIKKNIVTGSFEGYFEVPAVWVAAHPARSVFRQQLTYLWPEKQIQNILGPKSSYSSYIFMRTHHKP